MFRGSICFLGLLAFAIEAGGRGPLTSDELKMFQDPGGWQYITISDTDSGVPTQHTCFDGKPHPQTCSGTLTFTAGMTFVQSTHIHGQTVSRHGTYQLAGNQLTFFDELGTQDGPYALNINTKTKHLVLKLPPLRMELELQSQYKQDMQAAQQQHQ